MKLTEFYPLLEIYNSRGWLQLNEVIRIPIIEYLIAFLLAGLVSLGLWIVDKARRLPEPVRPDHEQPIEQGR